MNDIWDPLVEVEKNSYFWNHSPKIETCKKVSNKKLIHVDLFSGCGGFSVGFEQAGFATEIANDIHTPSIDTIRHNFKYANTILGDINKINPNVVSELISDGKKPLVLTAGIPCQGFSLSNRKRHDDDQRNYLFRQFIKFAKILKPDALIIENVSGIATAKSGYFKNEIKKAIENLGYDVFFSYLNAADYGVPQIRKRFFFVGVPRGQEFLFPYPTYQKQNYITVGDALIGDLPSLKINEVKIEYKGKPVNDYQRYIRGSFNKLLNHKGANHPDKTIKRIKNTKQGLPMYDSFRQRIRLTTKLPSPTQICGGIRPQFQFGHPTQARGLSIRERARIQSFPDNFFISGGIVQGRVQTGNAVPVRLSFALAKQLKQLLEGKKIRGIKQDPYQIELFN